MTNVVPSRECFINFFRASQFFISRFFHILASNIDDILHECIKIHRYSSPYHNLVKLKFSLTILYLDFNQQLGSIRGIYTLIDIYRSEERRVGKEYIYRWWQEDLVKK